MKINKKENPFFVNEYLTHLSVVKCLSDSTVMGYYQDIRQFLRFLQFREMQPDVQPTAEMLMDLPICEKYKERFFSSDAEDDIDDELEIPSGVVNMKYEDLFKTEE